jgi:ABC-type dipeptide/oligopeptide/nickel transport system permease subunit
MTQEEFSSSGSNQVDRSTPSQIGEMKRSALTWSKVKSNKMLLIGGIIVFIFFFMAIFAPYLTSYSPTKMYPRERFAPPSAKHLMGTDQFGRDTYARILYGAQVSFKVGIVCVLIGMIGGVLIGAPSGFVGGFTDHLLMRIMDGLLAFPPLLLAIGLVAAMGPSLTTVSISIGVIYIPRFARVMRAAVMAEREKEYVEAARAIGQSRFKILVKHIGPTTISPVVIMGTIIFALSVILEAALSFLGVGLPPPMPSWGTMLDESRRFLGTSAWMLIFPGMTISLAVLGFNLLGDGLRDFLDPKVYAITKTNL